MEQNEKKICNGYSDLGRNLSLRDLSLSFSGLSYICLPKLTLLTESFPAQQDWELFS